MKGVANTRHYRSILRCYSSKRHDSGGLSHGILVRVDSVHWQWIHIIRIPNYDRLRIALCHHRVAKATVHSTLTWTSSVYQNSQLSGVNGVSASQRSLAIIISSQRLL